MSERLGRSSTDAVSKRAWISRLPAITVVDSCSINLYVLQIARKGWVVHWMRRIALLVPEVPSIFEYT